MNAKFLIGIASTSAFFVACGSAAKQTTNGTCTSTQTSCAGTCKTTTTVDVSGTVLDVLGHAAVTNANMTVLLQDAPATGLVTKATTTIALGSNSFSFSKVDTTCGYTNVAIAVAPTGASDPVMPTVILVQPGTPKADITGVKATVVTKANAETLDTDLSLSGDNVVEKAGVALLFALKSDFTPMAGATAVFAAQPAQPATAKRSYPMVEMGGVGTATDASGLIVVTGAPVSANGPAFLSVTPATGAAQVTPAPLLPATATITPVLFAQ